MTEMTAALIGPFAHPADRDPIRQADVIIAVDRGIDQARRLGLTPAIAVGDFDSVSESGHQWALDPANGIAIIRVAAEKDFSDLDLALRTCIQRQVRIIDLFGFVGGRLDHQLALIGVCARYAHLATIRLIGDDEHARFLFAEHSIRIEKGVRFSVLALGNASGGEAEVSIVGAQYPLDRQNMPLLSDRGLSNYATKVTTVTVHAGNALVIVAQKNPPQCEGSIVPDK